MPDLDDFYAFKSTSGGSQGGVGSGCGCGSILFVMLIVIIISLIAF